MDAAIVGNQMHLEVDCTGSGPVISSETLTGYQMVK
jgi:hypothetical protein